MLQRIMLIADGEIPDETFKTLYGFGGDLADHLQEPVGLALAGKTRLAAIRTALMAAGGAQYLEQLLPQARASAAPMTSAPFVWREDGRPDWAAMWTGFCELALYGGPLHRGEEDALCAPEQPVLAPVGEFDAIAEIRRGIWETTGLFAEPAEEPGWIAVTCHSKKMAAWLCATVILENVDARCEEERLFLPASQDFELKNQVKSVITVLAKTNHYWEAHIAAQAAAEDATAAS